MLKQRLLAGAIGPLRRIRGRGLWPRDTAYYRRNKWAGQRQVAGHWVLDSPLSNAFGHFLNLALFFAGPQAAASAAPTGVQADLLRARADRELRHGRAAGARRLGGGDPLLREPQLRQNLEPELVFEGDRGRASWSYGREIRLEPAGAPAEVIALGDAHAARRAMFRQVIRKVREPAAFVCDTAMAAAQPPAANSPRNRRSHAVPESFLRREPAATGGEQISIAGIEGLVARAWSACQLFREAGFPWLPPAVETPSLSTPSLMKRHASHVRQSRPRGRIPAPPQSDGRSSPRCSAPDGVHAYSIFHDAATGIRSLRRDRGRGPLAGDRPDGRLPALVAPHGRCDAIKPRFEPGQPQSEKVFHQD